MSLSNHKSVRRFGATLLFLSSWGVLLGFLYGVISGVVKLAIHGYLHHKLYRLAAIEMVRALYRSSLLLVGTVLLASLVLWLLEQSVSRLIRRLHLNSRKRWYFLILAILLTGCLVLLVLFVVDANQCIQWLKQTQAEPYCQGILRLWRDSDYPSHFGAIVFFMWVGIVPFMRWLFGRRIASLKSFYSNRIFICACIAVIMIVVLAAATSLDHSLHKVGGKNVILITVDTLRADHLSCYGYKRDTSPQIDQLAKDGLLFWNAYSPSNWTLPSMSSIYTSLYPSEHGAITKDRRFPDRCVTLAEAMRNAGYSTMAVVSHYFVSRKYGFSQGFDIYDQTNMAGHDAVTSNEITETALKLLNSSRDKPFFLWIHYFDPHYSYIHHAEYDYGINYKGKLPSTLRYQEISSARNELSPADIQYVRDLYDEEIAYTDHSVGRLLHALHDLGMEDNTLIVLTSDHGEEFMERGDFGHHSKLYNELIRIPLIIAGAIEPEKRGMVVKNNVEVRNVAKTILSLCGISSDMIQGESLLATALDGDDISLCFSGASNPGDEDDRRIAVIEQDHKLIWDLRKQQYELYDIHDDPGEHHNLFKSGSELAEHLINLLNVKLHEFAQKGGQAVPRLNFNKNELQHLRSLGYVE